MQKCLIYTYMNRCQFSVLHIFKHKKGLKVLGVHIDRTYSLGNINPAKVAFNEAVGAQGLHVLDVLGSYIDNSKSDLKEEYAPSNQLSLEKSVRHKIKQGHRVKDKVRKDAVLALGVILTGSHERMIEIQREEKLFKDWKEANYKFVCRIFEKGNIVRFTLHVDRRTPYFHGIVVPISPQGRLSARYYVNGREKLENYQDQYGAAMAPFGLLRGIPKVITQREHISTRAYYYYRKLQALEEESQVLISPIEKKNVF